MPYERFSYVLWYALVRKRMARPSHDCARSSQRIAWSVGPYFQDSYYDVPINVVDGTVASTNSSHAWRLGYLADRRLLIAAYRHTALRGNYSLRRQHTCRKHSLGWSLLCRPSCYREQGRLAVGRKTSIGLKSLALQMPSQICLLARIQPLFIFVSPFVRVWVRLINALRSSGERGCHRKSDCVFFAVRTCAPSTKEKLTRSRRATLLWGRDSPPEAAKFLLKPTMWRLWKVYSVSRFIGLTDGWQWLLKQPNAVGPTGLATWSTSQTPDISRVRTLHL